MNSNESSTVIVADVDEGKLQLATRFGAQHTVNSTRVDLLEEVARLTNGEGVAVAIEAVGLPQTFRQAVKAVCYAGRVVYVGYAKTVQTRRIVRNRFLQQIQMHDLE